MGGSKTVQLGATAPKRRKLDLSLPRTPFRRLAADSFAKERRKQVLKTLPPGTWRITADGLVDWVDWSEPAEVSVARHHRFRPAQQLTFGSLAEDRVW